MTTPEGVAVASKLTAWLRTVLPGGWAALVAWLVGQLAIPASWGTAAEVAGQAVLVPIALAAVYPAMRWLEPHVPRWVVLALLGSAQQPVYVPPAVVADAKDPTTLTPTVAVVAPTSPDEVAGYYSRLDRMDGLE